MASTNTSHQKSELPTLLANKGTNHLSTLPLLEALSEIRSEETDIPQLLSEASEDTGFEFLFEIPGALFEHERMNAFVMRYEGEEQYFHRFVVYDPEEDKVAIMTYDEITPRARKFFTSYYGVLSCLSKIPAVRKLN